MRIWRNCVLLGSRVFAINRFSALFFSLVRVRCDLRCLPFASLSKTNTHTIVDQITKCETISIQFDFFSPISFDCVRFCLLFHIFIFLFLFVYFFSSGSLTPSSSSTTSSVSFDVCVYSTVALIPFVRLGYCIQIGFSSVFQHSAGLCTHPFQCE